VSNSAQVDSDIKPHQLLENNKLQNLKKDRKYDKTIKRQTRKNMAKVNRIDKVARCYKAC